MLCPFLGRFRRSVGEFDEIRSKPGKYTQPPPSIDANAVSTSVSGLRYVVRGCYPNPMERDNAELCVRRV
jgi:hypothetical protein